MPAKKIVSMLLLLVFLIGGFLYFERQSERSEKFDLLAEDLISGVRWEDVYKVHLIRAGNSFAAYRKGFEIAKDGSLVTAPPEGSPWLLNDPQGAPTIPESVSTFVQNLLAIKVENSVKSEMVSSDQGVYGLRPPEMVLTIQGRFGKRVLSFGKKHEISERRYVQKEDDSRILLIEDADFESINISKDAVRSKQPLQFDAAAVNTVTILRRDKDIPLILKKTSKDPIRWQLTAAGVEVDADTNLIQSQLEKLSKIEVDRFILPSVAPLHTFGLHDPILVLRLAIEREDGSEQDMMLQFSEAAKAQMPLPNNQGTVEVGLYFFRVSFETWIYQLVEPAFRGWLQTAEHFRDTRPFSTLSSPNVLRIALRKDAKNITLSSVDENGAGKEKRWVVKTDSAQHERSVSPKRFEAWFQALAGIRILSYPSLSPADRKRAEFESPVFSVTIERRDEPGKPYSLIVGGALKAVNVGKDEPLDPNAPRYGLLTGADRRQVAVVVSASLLSDLSQDAKYFLDGKAVSQ